MVAYCKTNSFTRKPSGSKNQAGIYTAMLETSLIQFQWTNAKKAIMK